MWHTRSSPASVSYETSSKSHASRLRKTSVSFETFSKSHASSLQNERFVRDFLQKSHVKSPKRAFRTRLPPKLTCQSLQNEHFVGDFLQKSSGNITQPCQAVSRFQPLQTTSAQHANPNVTATFTSTTTHNLTILCATNLSTSTRLTRTKYCACHEMSPPSHLATSHKNRTSTPQNPHKVLRPPRKVTISYHVSFKKNLRRTTRLE